ncbi:probable indole-3-pyruvate monooxygenase YUCCA10 [Andrographis paniculata]|uniref:probable indole-3-pyruvate monooxygenase YUCCA10 n=1 Tax=Andrographis paniculata TaxID=175694 RepID=UPI0021E8EF94|nr:probable indole-3-pyruvate monooxygenase YUCCA10 [Andrographis paniculata]
MAAAAAEAAVTIVGAGPSGLATAAYLRHLSIPYTILEREDCYASLWQKYSYDRLHLHLTKHACSLPLMPMPETYRKYPSRRDFLAYLADYVARFEIRPQYRRRVVAAEYDETRRKWRIRARNLAAEEEEEYESRFLVVATGETCDPHVPALPGLGDFAGEVIHSTRYKNGEKFGGKSVLVVGCGNSGMEISLDLAESGARTSLVVRTPAHVVSKGIVNVGLVLLKYLPFGMVDWIVSLMSKLVYGDLTKYGFSRPKEGPFAMKLKYGKYPIIDVGTLRKIRSRQIQVLPEIASIKGNNIEFKNGGQYPFDAIVFATGFKRSTKQWLKGGDSDGLLNDDGLPEYTRANKWKGSNGLYCAGLSRKGLFGSASDAQSIAFDIEAHL